MVIEAAHRARAELVGQISTLQERLTGFDMAIAALRANTEADSAAAAEVKPPLAIPAADERPAAASITAPVGKPLSPREQQLLDWLADLADRNEPAPTNGAIAKRFGVKSNVGGLYILKPLEMAGLILVERSGNNRIVTIAATGKRTAMPTPPKNVGRPAKVPGTVTMKQVVAWLCKAGVTCADAGGGTFMLGSEYVGARDVLERANRKRRTKGETEFVVSGVSASISASENHNRNR